MTRLETLTATRVVRLPDLRRGERCLRARVCGIAQVEDERGFRPTARISDALPIFERPSIPSRAASRRSSVTVIAPAPVPVPFRSAALAGRRFGSFPAERRAGLLRQLGDGPLPPGSRLGLFDVLARNSALLLCRHPRLLAMVPDFSPFALRTPTTRFTIPVRRVAPAIKPTSNPPVVKLTKEGRSDWRYQC